MLKEVEIKNEFAKLILNIGIIKTSLFIVLAMMCLETIGAQNICVVPPTSNNFFPSKKMRVLLQERYPESSELNIAALEDLLPNLTQDSICETTYSVLNEENRTSLNQKLRFSYDGKTSRLVQHADWQELISAIALDEDIQYFFVVNRLVVKSHWSFNSPHYLFDYDLISSSGDVITGGTLIARQFLSRGVQNEEKKDILLRNIHQKICNLIL